MFFSFNIFFLSALFAANLWLSVSYAGYAGWFGIIFSLIIIVAARMIVGRWKFTVLPAVLVPGAVLLLSLIDPSLEMKIFIFFSTLAFYATILAGWRLFRYEKDETAKAMYNIATVAVLFCWYAASYGWYLNPSISLPIWVLLIVFSVITFLVSYVSFAINQIDREKWLIYSIFLTTLVAQTVWIQNFWPFGYLTVAVITLIIYCVGWEIILSFFLKKLTVRTVLFEILFLAGSVVLVLLSTKWYPVI
ncbi:MAG: hypothetical protein NT170_00830 [Candidatus Moranbacteria bacterium]|nr:hypothetical protein [Candidatus Moranbacteria bacterium]